MNMMRMILALAAVAIIPACVADSGGGSGGGGGGGGGESAGTLDFDSTQYSFNEAIPPVLLGGTIRPLPLNVVTVTRTGGSKGDVSVMVVVTGGSATQDVDYQIPVPGPLAGVVLSWADGETGAKSFVFNTIDDKLIEGTETVGLALSNVSGGATLGAIDKVTVYILDDDSPVVGPTSR